MRQVRLALVAMAAVAAPTAAWAVVTSTQVTVSSGGTPLASATISLQRVQIRTAPKPRTVPPRAPAPTDTRGGTALTFDTDDRNATFIVTVRDGGGGIHRLPPQTLDDIIRGGVDIRTAQPRTAIPRGGLPAEPLQVYPAPGGVPLSIGASSREASAASYSPSASR